VEWYKLLVDRGQKQEAASELFALAGKLNAEGELIPGKIKTTVRSSKVYKCVRAILKDSKALHLFFTRGLALPKQHEDRAPLANNLVTLFAISAWKELTELLLQSGALEQLRPLLAHCVEWLGQDQFVQQGREGRCILKLVMVSVVRLAGVDMEKGAAFAAECGVLPRVQELFPWKGHVRSLNLEEAESIEQCMAFGMGLLGFAVVGKKLACPLDDAIGSETIDANRWQQEVLLWAAAERRANAAIKKPLEAILVSGFNSLSLFVRIFLPGETNLKKLAGAEGLAKGIKDDVSTWSMELRNEATSFAESMGQARMTNQGSATPQFKEHSKEGDGEGQQARDGFHQKKSGTAGGPWSQELDSVDWAHLIHTLEAGDGATFRSLLTHLVSMCPSIEEGGTDASRSSPSMDCAVALIDALESGRFSKELQEPEALANFLTVLAHCVRQQTGWSADPLPGGGVEDLELWQAWIAVQLMQWLQPRLRHLAGQPLRVGTVLVQKILNATWTIKYRAVTQWGYLEYGYALCKVLQEQEASARWAKHKELWASATTYLMAVLDQPTSGACKRGDRGPEGVYFVHLVSHRCLERGMLEWAIERGMVAPANHEEECDLLIARILGTASSYDVGLKRFAACKGAMGVLLEELAEA
jgi:hypothetical protein